MSELHELEQAIGHQIKELERLRSDREVFQSDLWKRIVAVLDSVESGLQDKFAEDETIDPKLLRAQIKIVRALKNLPEHLPGVISELETSIQELEKHKVMMEFDVATAQKGL